MKSKKQEIWDTTYKKARVEGKEPMEAVKIAAKARDVYDGNIGKVVE